MSASGRQITRQPLLTVIVPVFNEQATIDELLREVTSATIPSYFVGECESDHTLARKQVVVVDDGSTDSSAERLKAWERHVIVVRHGINRGKGRAIRTGLQFATGTYTLIQDADLEYDPRDYPRLLAPLLSGKADVVYGSRYLRPKQRWSLCRFGVSLLNRCARWLYGLQTTDEATCYKIFRTDDLRAMDLQCERFEFCPEVTAKACRMGLSIVEVPIGYNARTIADGKKIRWRDGLSALATLWRWRKWQPPTLTTG